MMVSFKITTKAAATRSAITGPVRTADAATAGAGAYKRDYAAALSTSALSGLRIGVVRPEMTADVAARYEVALGNLKAAGAVLVEVKQPKLDGIGEAELLVLQTELKADLDTYLATTPATVPRMV